MLNLPNPNFTYSSCRPFGSVTYHTSIIRQRTTPPFEFDTRTKTFFNTVLWGEGVCLNSTLRNEFFYLTEIDPPSHLPHTRSIAVYFWDEVIGEWQDCSKVIDLFDINTAKWYFPEKNHNPVIKYNGTSFTEDPKYNPHYALTQASLGIDMKEALKILGNSALAEAIIEEYKKVNIINKGEMKLFLKAILSPDSYGPVINALEKIYERNAKNDISRTDGY